MRLIRCFSFGKVSNSREECYDQLTATFKIPVETEEQTEYL